MTTVNNTSDYSMQVNEPDIGEPDIGESNIGDLSLMGLFRLEVDTQVAVLNQHLIALEQSDNCLRSDHLDALMRAAHSIKGAARIIQIEAAVKVAHALEDCFIAAQQGILKLTGEHVDVLLMGVDLLSKIGGLDEQTLLDAVALQALNLDDDIDDVVVAIAEIVGNAERVQQDIKVTPSDKATTGEIEQRTTACEFDEADSADYAATVSSSLPFEEHVKAKRSVASGETLEQATLDNVQVSSTRSDADESNRMIRISAANLSRLMGLAGELLVESNWLEPFVDAMVETKRQQQSVISLLEQHSGSAVDESTAAMRTCQSRLSDRLEEVEQFSKRFGQLCDRLHREVIASHMCAFEEGTQGYARLVRDVAKSQGKKAVLDIVGLGTQIDRDILSKLDTPITHLLTNAITHGIEPPDVRMGKGKPATARIRLSAKHRSGMLIVEVEDDGAGIDFVQLRQKIAQKGMVPNAVVEELSEAELIEFLFLPGFSTATRVDQLAGRGYGLDLARAMAKDVGGTLQAFSSVSSSVPSSASSSGLRSRTGTRFQFSLPLTLSVVRSLLFKVAGEDYAISLSRISRVLKLAQSDIHYSEGRPYFRWEEGSISLVPIYQVLDLSQHQASNSKDEKLSVIVLGEGEQRYGLYVDRLIGEKELVIRPLDTRLGKIPNISAAALSEAGTPILVLDVADVLRAAEKASAGAAQWKDAEKALPNNASLSALSGALEEKTFDEKGVITHPKGGALSFKKILVVDDSMTVRAMEKNLLQNKGYAVDIAVDGAEGWNAVRANAYDLVITDVDMPRMSGIELINKMRAYEATQKLPVIVVSYKDREADQLAGLNAGANYYLTKSSFHNDGLITAVVDLIGS